MTSSPTELFDELERHFREVIEQMEDEFTSHQFFERLSQAQQTLYVQLLSAYNENGQPFQSVHSVIARRLKKNWKHLVRHVDTDAKSENIFGNHNSAAVWHKVS